MFVRPEQVALIVAAHPELDRARVQVSRKGGNDAMTIKLEIKVNYADIFTQTVLDVLKLRATIEICVVRSLPREGTVIEDLRDIG